MGKYSSLKVRHVVLYTIFVFGLCDARIPDFTSVLDQFTNTLKLLTGTSPILGRNLPQLNSEIFDKYLSGFSSEDRYLNTSALANKYGYPVETHIVTTEDGYILTLFRIKCGGPPVFLLPGLFLSSDDFLIAGPLSAIAYLLASQGYDVWLGNFRGNKYGRAHVNLDPDVDPKFWDFSWNEIGLYDLPAMIDYTLNVTLQSQLLYIGHSQGNTALFVLCSEKPKYNKKFKFVIAMAAAAYLSHMKSHVFRALSIFSDQEHFISQLLGVNELLPDRGFNKIVRDVICGNKALAVIICTNIVFPFIGYNYQQLNITNLPIIYEHSPAGSSTKQLIHYFQLVKSGKFRKFDYGRLKNLITYGSESPPDYPVKLISTPITIFYSDNDWLVDTKDARKLYNKLSNRVEFYKVPCRCNHQDFLWARDVKTLINLKILEIFNQYASPRTFNSTISCPLN